MLRHNSVSTAGKIPVVMIISATDPTGGAGMAADLRICSALRAYPLPIVTAITAQNHHGVAACTPTDPLLLRAQIKAALTDFRPDAVKIGLLPSPESVIAVAHALKANAIENVVFDPVLAPSKGGSLINDAEETIKAMITELPECVNLITPNRREYEILSRYNNIQESDVDWRAVLVTGGDDNGDTSTDKLLMYGHEVTSYSLPRISTPNLHGTGCVFSTAIATMMARGIPMREAIDSAKKVMAEVIKASSTVDCTFDYGPVLLDIPDLTEFINT